ncbi:hypothetical protein GJAV_G00000700 [Gymnothorax javanicus]|nr:hypothetical protein GJAV_G00000700 [Gymnothorax javanicus]
MQLLSDRVQRPSHSGSPPDPYALVSLGPLVVENRTTGNTKPRASSPTEPPFAMETTSRLPSYATSLPEQTPLGFPGVPPQGVPYLDGMPVQEVAWGQSNSVPQGWLATGAGSSQVTWVYPSVVADGGVVIVRHVPEEHGMGAVVGRIPQDPFMKVLSGQVDAFGMREPLVSPQNDVYDDTVLLQYHSDDPSGGEFLGWDSAENKLPDPALEESERKRWGGDLGTMIQEPEPANRKADMSGRGDEGNPLGGVALEDEGLVVQRTELVMHKGRGQSDAAILSALRSSLALTRSEGAAPKLRYEEEEEQGLGAEEQVRKRRVLMEEENVQPASLMAVLRRMYKAE